MKRLLLLLALVLAFNANVNGAEKFDLEGYASRFDSIPIGVVKFTSTNANVLKENFPWDIIENNLDLSGKFGVVALPAFDSAALAQKGIGVYVDGKYTLEADGKTVLIECYLRDVATRSLLVGKKYKGELKALRNMVHRYSNELVELLFSDKGIFESRIIYVRTEGAKKNIGIMDFDVHSTVDLSAKVGKMFMILSLVSRARLCPSKSIIPMFFRPPSART